MAQDEISIVRALPVVVRRPRGDPAKQNVGGRAKQNNSIELTVELTLVRHSPGDVEGWSALARQEFLDASLAPDVTAFRLRPLAPAPFIRLNHVEPTLRKLHQSCGLACARHAC